MEFLSERKKKMSSAWKKNLNKSFKLLLSMLIVLSSLAANINLKIASAETLENGIFASTYEASATTGGEKVLIDPNATINLGAITNIDSAKVAITNYKEGDTLYFVDQNGIIASFDQTNGLLTLSGSANAENYQTALRSVEFTTTSADLETRNVTFTIEFAESSSEENTEKVTYSMNKEIQVLAVSTETEVAEEEELTQEESADSETAEESSVSEEIKEVVEETTEDTQSASISSLSVEETEESDQEVVSTANTMLSTSSSLINNPGFEDDLNGWTTLGTVNALGGGNYHIGGSFSYEGKSYTIWNDWTINPYQNKMAVLTPSGNNNYTSVFNTLNLSTESQNYITGQFTNIRNFAYVYQDIELSANEEFTMAWNYIATDYIPFNDASFVSLVNLDNATSTPVVNGVRAQVGILGATVLGTGNYSTDSFGSTGWQTATFKAAEAGTYRLAFAIFNLTDQQYSPYLFVDKEPGVTLKNGEPFGPIPKDPNAPDPAGEVEPEIEQSAAPSADDITGNATDGTVTIKNVPENTTVKLYKNGEEIGSVSNESGTVTVSELTLSEDDTIQVTFTEDGKKESEQTAKEVQVRSATPQAEVVKANATTDEVTVKNVANGSIVTIYNEDGEKIGEATQTSESDDVKISIPSGLVKDQKIKVTVTNSGDLESLLLEIESILEKSAAPKAEEIVVNATDKTVTISNVPENTTVKVYKDSVEIASVISENGTVIIPDLDLEKDEEVQITFTEQDKTESDSTAKTAQERSDAVEGDKIVANATTNTVTIKDVPANAVIKIYNNADPSVLIGEATNGDTSGKVIITIDEDLTVNESIELTVTLPRDLESLETSVQPIDQSATLQTENVSVNATNKYRMLLNQMILLEMQQIKQLLLKMFQQILL